MATNILLRSTQFLIYSQPSFVFLSRNLLRQKEKKRIKEGILGDIAPTILDLLEVEIPKIMTQKSLLIKKFLIL